LRVQVPSTLTPDANKGNPKAAPIPSPRSMSLQRPPVFNQRGAQQGEEYDQEEWVYLVRTSTFEPSSRNWTETESATIREHRWWSIDELRATNEVVFPSDLANHLERHLSH